MPSAYNVHTANTYIVIACVFITLCIICDYHLSSFNQTFYPVLLITAFPLSLGVEVSKYVFLL